MSDSDTLVELLAQNGIRLKSYQPGHNQHVTCPACGGGRTRETSLSVTIDADGAGATWICHRGLCLVPPGGARVRGNKPSRPSPMVYQKPPPIPDATATNRPDWLYEAFSERRIGARVVNALGIYAAERDFQHPFGKLKTIVFPYVFKGETVNRKYRSHPKQAMMQEKGALPTLYNIDRLCDAPAEVVWVEGEMDVAAMMECGIVQTVSLKDGAPKTAAIETDPDAKRFSALKTHSDLLNEVPRFVLAGDMDAPGMALKEELARRLGRHRCHFVVWPGDCKDAGDTLRVHGPDAVLEAYRGARPYPVDGLQTIEGGTLTQLRNTLPPATMTTGTRSTDLILKLPTEGRLIVVTGWPGSGKTNWTRFVMIHSMREHRRRWGVFSPEMQPWEQFAAECAEVCTGKPFWPTLGLVSMTDDEIAKCEGWLMPRLTMLVCDAEDKAPTIDWILDHARIAALRDGITDLLIDPWNEIDHTRAVGMTETDYIGRSLQRLKAFGLRHGCNVWLIAHPAKPAALPSGEKRGHPGAYDISGSANWFNRADLGLTVHSPGTNLAELHVWKSRFVRRWGNRGAVATMAFDPIVGRYDDMPDSEPAQSWHDR